MTTPANGEAFRAAYARVVGRPPDVRGPEWCPECRRPAALSVFVHPDRDGVGVECANGCWPFMVTDALGLPVGSLEVPEEDDAPPAPAALVVTATRAVGPFARLRPTNVTPWSFAR